jgi:hypothetical protein
MIMRTGERWLCVNPYCGDTVTLRSAYYSREDPPRCPCGSPLRKVSASADFSYLDFLRSEEPASSRKPAKKD